MKLYIIAGEASGDLHGSNLIRALRESAPETEIQCWGGDLMQAAGGRLRKHYRELAFMGFVEVVANLRTIMANLAFCKKDILDFQPDALVLIDYPGFNMRIARWAKRQGIRVIWYISPQIWAWHQSRVKAIQRDVDQMLVILPFETAFYRQYGVNVHFVGHPLLDAIGDVPDQERNQSPPLVALLPGSRKQEVRRILPVMLSIIPYFPQYQFVIAGSNALPEAYYRQFIPENITEVRLEMGKTYELLRRASAALVKSGTSTLETALHLTPQVVCYSGNPISYAIARRVIQVKYISLVNLIADAPVVKELIQDQLNTENLRHELARLFEPESRREMLQAYQHLRGLLGEKGASHRAAQIILQPFQQA